jgi:opacity protein-like surface antigen
MVTLRGGFAHANAGSDIFSFTTNQLTVDRGDFSGFIVGADLGLRIAPRFDIVLGASYAGTSTPSEFRDFVDQANLPIEQTTTFQRVPVTASVKAYLTPPGRAVGHFAWIPARFAPYIGGGGGAVWYRFRQRGDFVDFQTNDIFRDSFTSSGWAPEAHAMAGVDVSLGTRFLLVGEGRYTWARAKLGDDFSGFDRIDLSGFAVTAGVGVRF